MVSIEVSVGELFDKITILRIKQNKLTDQDQLANVNKELEYLEDKAFSNDPEVNALVEELESINEQLWDVEDELRVLESKADFGQEFINKARSVYFLNDERAALKKAVNVLTGSTIVEAKSYIDYTVRGTDSQE